MPYQSVFGNQGNAPANTPSTGGYKSVFGNDTTWQNNQPSAKPQSIQQPQQTNPIQQVGNIFNQVGNAVSNTIEHPPNVAPQVGNFFSQLGSFIKTNIVDNPAVKNIGKALAPAGTAPMKGTTQNISGDYVYTGDTVRDIANVILTNLPAFGASGGEAAQGFSKSKALISAAVQAGVQIAAGAAPKEVIKSLPFGFAGGAKFHGEILPKINTIKESAMTQAKENLPVVLSPREIQAEVVGSNLKNTPLGKELIKTSFQTNNHNSIQINYDEASNLKTPAGIPVRVDVIPSDHAINTQGMAQEVKNINVKDLVVHESAPDTATIAQYKNEIQSGARPPLVVIKEGSQWGVEDGKHKLEAYKQLGIEDIPTIEKVLSPEGQKVNDLKATVTPDDHILNPIIDDIIRTNESQTSSPASSFQEISNTKTNEESITQPKTSRAINQPNETVSQGVTKSQSSIKSQSPESPNLSRENISGQPKPKNTINVKSESTISNSSRNGEGLITSKLGLRVEQTAIERKLTSELKDLPGYEQMNMKEQAQKASDLLKSDPQKAYDIALGKESPPKGLKAESIFKAIENSITTPEQATELAHSPLVKEASDLGQRIKALDVKTSESPVEAIKQVINAREKAIKEKTGQTIHQATTDTIKEIQQSIEKTTPKKGDWASFVKSIQC